MPRGYNPHNPAYKAKTPFETAPTYRRLSSHCMRLYDECQALLTEAENARAKYNGAFQEELLALGGLTVARNSLMESANQFNGAAELYNSGLIPRPNEEGAEEQNPPANEEPKEMSDYE